MKVLLVQPKIEAMVTFQDFMLAPPLTLELLAATLQDHEVRILDLRVQNGLIEELALFQPDIVGITCLTQEVYAALKILTRVKEYNAHILTVVGGIHASLAPHDFEREFVDVIVIGEGEVTLRELVDAYQDQKSLKGITGIEYMDDGHWIQTHPRAFIPDLDSLPSPDRRLNKEYADHYFSMAVSPVGALLTSRGCPFRCKFCSVWKLFSQKCRYMTAERVVEEILNIDAGYVIIFDDNFLQNIPRAETIYEMIRSEGVRKEYFIQARSDTVSRNAGIIEKWKEIGLDEILVGFESIKVDELKGMGKGNSPKHNEEAIRILAENGISILAAFIINPDYEPHDFDDIIAFLEKMQMRFPRATIYPRLSILTPLPGTDLYEERYRDLITHDYRLYDTLHAVLATRLPREAFYKQYAKAWKKCVNVMVKAMMKKEREGLLETANIDPSRVHNLLQAAKRFSNYRSFLEDERDIEGALS